MLNEFYRVAFRKKVHRSIDELQADLDAWVREYNEGRPHQGRWCFGKTPMQTFLDAMPIAKGDRQIEYQLIHTIPTVHRACHTRRRASIKKTPWLAKKVGVAGSRDWCFCFQKRQQLTDALPEGRISNAACQSP